MVIKGENLIVEKINRCFRIHLNLSNISDFNIFFDRLVSIGNVTIVENSVLIWLKDDVDKSALVKTLKKSKVLDFFCEPIEYENIGKEDNYNYMSAWFIDNYRNYTQRLVEKNNQETLREMYNNIERAKELLANKQECVKDSDDKKYS